MSRLEYLWDQLGPDEGERTVSAAMEDLAVLLRDVLSAWTASDLTAVRVRAMGIQGIADRLGMGQVYQIAGDIIALCGTSDDAALAATIARLGRVGERSLFAIWDAQTPVN